MKLILNTLPVCLLAIFLTACGIPKEIKENEDIAQQVINTPRLIQNHVLYMKGADGDFKLHYVNSDPRDTTRDTVVFVHGTPGDWTSFANYFLNTEFKRSFRITSIDRPGWGRSTYAGDFPASLETQSKMIGPVLQDIWEHNGKQKIILVGHSLGGSLAPILAADYPDFIRGVIILAGDLKPELAQARWYNTALNWTPNFLIPSMWNHSNMEVLELTNSLEAAQAKLAKLTIPISILQGTDDTLVDPANAAYATLLFKNNDLKVEWIKEAGHIINLQHPDKVIEAIYDMNARSVQLK